MYHERDIICHTQFQKLLFYFLRILLLAGYGKLATVQLKIIIMIIVAFFLDHIVQFMDLQLTILICTKDVQDNLFLLFVVGFIVATVFEYFASFFLEKVFHMKLWDYSHLWETFKEE